MEVHCIGGRSKRSASRMRMRRSKELKAKWTLSTNLCNKSRSSQEQLAILYHSFITYLSRSMLTCLFLSTNCHQWTSMVYKVDLLSQVFKIQQRTSLFHCQSSSLGCLGILLGTQIFSSFLILRAFCVVYTS